MNQQQIEYVGRIREKVRKNVVRDKEEGHGRRIASLFLVRDEEIRLLSDNRCEPTSEKFR